MHLPHARDIQHREQRPHVKLGTGFFNGFPRCTFGRGFAHFHESGGQRPFAKLRLNVALAQQNLRAIGSEDRHSPHHIERVFVMNRVAGRAYRTLTGVAVFRQSVNHGGAAVSAVFDRRTVHHFKCTVERMSSQILATKGLIQRLRDPVRR